MDLPIDIARPLLVLIGIAEIRGGLGLVLPGLFPSASRRRAFEDR